MDYPPASRRAFSGYSHGLHSTNTAPFDRPLWVRALHAFGEVAVTIGLVLLLFAAYEFYGKAWEMDRAQHRLDRDLERQWSMPTRPRGGQPIGRLHIPRLHKKWVVVSGVTQASLAKGPGRYPKSGIPGELGNVTIAGHRSWSVFWDLDRLRPGDSIIAETRTAWFVYRVIRLLVVRPSQTEVVAPDPDHPRARPTRRLLTLTTCNPKFQNYQRLIAQAEQTSTHPKPSHPPELPR